ncbi:unnamed protein product [Cylicostephanus goldi]|uniref:PNPLA domain-containing protein n=1 Tax=Cylicostephanus goldi TaxID=71465 RepID=A0A3P6QYT7_CYLGO|nr:unnamed protein product [Cylicostephanus goldi]
MSPSAPSTLPAPTKTPWDYQQDAAIKTQKESKEISGQRVNLLSLDGGGIRGLVLIQMLSELESKFGPEFLASFGWLAGTSTGAILALALSQGKTIPFCRSMYFRMKDEIFLGVRPYNADTLDAFLRSEFGENTTMADVTSKRVMVTTCVANVCPPQLHLLRSYQLEVSEEENAKLGFSPPKNHFIKDTARASSAAPTYFPPFDKKYVDGGLLANNPCPQLLMDVQLVNTSLKMANKDDQCYHVGCVLSLGTGRVPQAMVDSLELTVPKSFIEFATGFQDKLSLISHLKNLLLDQVRKIHPTKSLWTWFFPFQIGRADGAAVDCSRAWSHSMSVPFFRYSPQLSSAIDLDETDDIKLINIMWGTKVRCFPVLDCGTIRKISVQVYMKEENSSVEQLIDLLKSCKR